MAEARRAGIFGAPVSYIALLAAVTAAFQLIPFSVVLGPGLSFPLSLAIDSLVGILLGPWAGGLAVLIGSVIGIMIAPHTAFLGPFTIAVVTLPAIVAGLIVIRQYYVAAAIMFAGGLWWVISYAMILHYPDPKVYLYPWRYFVPAVLLLFPALNEKALRLLQSENRLGIAVAVGYISWIGSQSGHFISATVGDIYLFRLPQDVLNALIFIITPGERAVLDLVAMVVGLGVITGLRQMGARRPAQGIW
ncbi:MAG: hypothetical protein M1136_02100 [Chloroflexi bacterium]|nr:hypothetical protein [Chloroflexota bacterium]MCL5074430.1 hypothetical protein [Chloroflexota bacterium]